MLQLIRRGGPIESANRTQKLTAVQKKQLTLALQDYLGEKVTLARAFGDEMVVERLEAVDDDAPDDVHYDVWEVVVDTSYVFKPNSAEHVPVVRTQGRFEPETDAWSALAHALNAAPYLDDPDLPIVYVQDGPKRRLITGFKRSDFIPTDEAWAMILDWSNRLTEELARQCADNILPTSWARIVPRVAFESQQHREQFLRDFAKKFNKKAWEEVSKLPLGATFVRDFATKLNWVWLTRKQADEVLREHPERVAWNEVPRKPRTEAFLREFASRIDFSAITVDHLPEAFVREYFHTLSARSVAMHPTLSEQFLREHTDQLDWWTLSRRADLSDAFLEDFTDKVDWNTVSAQHHITVDFVERFADRLDYEALSHNTLPEDVVRRFATKLDWASLLIRATPPYDDALVLEHLDYIDAPAWTTARSFKRYPAIQETVAAAIAQRDQP